MPLPLPPSTLLRVARRYGTPTYVYAEAVVRRQCEKLRRLLRDLPVELLYAMKANSNPALLRIIHEEGFGVDAVSQAEMLLALRLGWSPRKILFSANMMTDAEMHAAAQAGVLLNIGELTRLERFGAAYPGAKVSVRLNPRHGAGHHAHVVTAGGKTKFGVPVEQIDRVLDIARKHHLSIVGIHQHIGSGILDAARFWEAISVLLDHADQFPDVRFVNLGGGLGVPYRPDEQEIDEAAFRARVVEPLAAFARQRPEVQLRFEPGRFIVAQAGVLLTTANTVKEGSERVFVGTDTGMGHLVRPALYESYHQIENLSRPGGPPRVYDVTGNICETGDVFAHGRELAEVREGDVLALLDAGAYGMSMASTYNLRPLPAEVLVGEDEKITLLTPRLTPEALVEQLLSGS